MTVSTAHQHPPGPGPRPTSPPRTSRTSAANSTPSASRSSPAAASATPPTSARSSTVQRKLELSSRAVLLFSLFPPAWIVGTAGLSVSKIVENMEIGHNVMHGQWDWMRDSKIHSTTWEWDNASPADMWKHSHNEVHHTYTNVLGKDHDLGYGIMRVDEDQKWTPVLPRPAAVELHQRLLVRVRHRGLRPGDRQVPQGPDRQGRVPPQGQAGARARSASRRSRDYVLHPLLSGPSALTTLDREPDGEPGPQSVDALGHHVRALPRGRRDLREDLDRRRDARRVVPAPDARLGQHLAEAR